MTTEWQRAVPAAAVPGQFETTKQQFLAAAAGVRLFHAQGHAEDHLPDSRAYGFTIVMKVPQLAKMSLGTLGMNSLPNLTKLRHSHRATARE